MLLFFIFAPSSSPPIDPSAVQHAKLQVSQQPAHTGPLILSWTARCGHGDGHDLGPGVGIQAWSWSQKSYMFGSHPHRRFQVCVCMCV
jgi:hypothetical protein